MILPIPSKASCVSAQGAEAHAGSRIVSLCDWGERGSRDIGGVSGYDVSVTNTTISNH